ncbi:unnamed protein product, partial [Tetraodon nigroviridis]
IFVVGIGFFSLCFLMTSLGGQFSAKRLGDSPFTIRTEGTDTHTRPASACFCANTILSFLTVLLLLRLRCNFPLFGQFSPDVSDVSVTIQSFKPSNV